MVLACRVNKAALHVIRLGNVRLVLLELISLMGRIALIVLLGVLNALLLIIASLVLEVSILQLKDCVLLAKLIVYFARHLLNVWCAPLVLGYLKLENVGLVRKAVLFAI